MFLIIYVISCCTLSMLPCDAFYGTPVKFVAFVRLLLGLAYTHDYTQVIDLYWTLPFNVVWSPKYVMNYHLTIYNNLATALSRCTEKTSVTKTENEVIIYSPTCRWRVRLSFVILKTILQLHGKQCFGILLNI